MRRPRFLARRKSGDLGLRLVIDGEEIIAAQTDDFEVMRPDQLARLRRSGFSSGFSATQAPPTTSPRKIIQPTCVVRLEQLQALVRIVDVERGDLARHMRAGGDQPGQRRHRRLRHGEGRRQTDQRAGIEPDEPRLGVLAEQARGRASRRPGRRLPCPDGRRWCRSRSPTGSSRNRAARQGRRCRRTRPPSPSARPRKRRGRARIAASW